MKNQCEFLVGYYFNGEPSLFHIDIERCTALPTENRNFAAIGIGNDLAKFLLKEYNKVDSGFACADQIAIDVIATVKDNVKDCAGPAQVGISFPSTINNMEKPNLPFSSEPNLIHRGKTEFKFEALFGSQKRAYAANGERSMGRDFSQNTGDRPNT